MEQQIRTMDYYGRIKDIFEKQYWSAPSRNRCIPNGYSTIAPIQKKAALFGGLIDHPGKVLDMGCGNGLLLKLLISGSRHELVPYGVDILKQSVRQAQNEVLPEYRKNFSVGNINDFEFKRRFDYILFSPVYLADEDFQPFFKRCCASLNPQGKLMMYVDQDTFPIFKMRKRTIAFLKSRPVHWHAGDFLYGHMTYCSESKIL